MAIRFFHLIRFFGFAWVALFFSLFLLEVGSQSEASVDQEARSQLMSSFKEEIRQLERQQRREIADLKVAHHARRKSLKKEINQQRRECFKIASRGSEKRTCVQEARLRWKTMRQMLKDEMKSRLSEQQVKKKSLQDEQRQKLSDFDAGKLTSGP